MIKHQLSAYPKTNISYEKRLGRIFAEFYPKVDFPEWKPSSDDGSLWQIFRLKVDLIRAEMAKEEVVKTPTGYIIRSQPQTELLLPPCAEKASPGVKNAVSSATNAP